MGRFDALTQLDKKPVPSTPLPERSEPVQAATTYENTFASKPANQQGSKPVSMRVGLPARKQTSKQTNQQTRLPANQQTSKQLKKFSSYLTETSLKGLKRIAFETDRKDYEILQEAVDHYLQRT